MDHADSQRAVTPSEMRIGGMSSELPLDDGDDTP